MVLEDRLHDRDGIFSCPLGASDAPDCTKNPKFVACNSTSGPKPAYCKHLDNCPNHFNPGQEDFDNNIVGNACDVGWTSDPYRPTAFQTYGDFDGDHRADILVQNAGNIGILKYDGNSFAQLMIASDGALFGSWRYNSATDHVVAIADFNGDGKDDILVTCPERTGTVPCTNNIGILTFNGSSLTSLMTAPSETWFGGWRFQADVNRVAGTADLNRDGRQDIVVTSGWGMGILTFDGSSLTPLVVAPNGTQ